MKTVKITLYNFKRAIIEGYDELSTITNTKIVADLIVVKGENLQIRSLDSFCIEIVGDIFEVVNDA